MKYLLIVIQNLLAHLRTCATCTVVVQLRCLFTKTNAIQERKQERITEGRCIYDKREREATRACDYRAIW